jgi:hypothetical protein
MKFNTYKNDVIKILIYIIVDVITISKNYILKL